MFHQHFLWLAELLPEPMLLLDARGEILACNQAAERAAPTLHRDLAGRRLTELVEDADAATEFLRRCGDSRQMVSGSMTMLDGDGRPVQYLCEGVGVAHSMEASPAIVVRLIPVKSAAVTTPAESSATEVELAASQQQLRQALEEKTRIMAQLQLANDAAESAGRAKAEFLANISHELRTPMTAIIGMTNLALEEDLPPLVREQISTVEQSAASLLQSLNEILEFSLLDSGQVALEHSPFNLRQLVRDALNHIKPKAASKQLALRSHVASRVPPVVIGDEARLRQVLACLLDNAVKFTSQGHVRLEVAAQPGSPSHASLVFSVSDTGAGMTPDVQERVFAPFMQGDASSTRPHGGSGLGLSICSNLVAMMGGRVWVHSEVGRGSTFFLSVNLALPEQPPARSADPDSLANRTLRILVADDIPANQRLIAQILEKQGHRVDLVSNGHQALTMARQHAYDLVLMDIQMPVMDGFQTTHALRESSRPGEPHIPIVAMTAHAVTGSRDRCLAAGMDAYLPKPIERAKLLDIIHRLVARGESASAAPLNSNHNPNETDRRRGGTHQASPAKPRRKRPPG